MTGSMFSRAQAAAGAAAVAVLLVALALPGRPPRTADPNGDVIKALVDHRDGFLVANYLIGIGALLLLLFLGALRAHVELPAGRRDPLAGSVLAAGAAGTALLVAGLGIIGGLAFSAGERDPAVVRAFIDAGNLLVGMAGLAFAAMLAAGSAAAARTDALPQALRALGYAGAVYLVLTRVSLSIDSGVFQAAGPLDLSAIAPLAVWLFAASVVIVRRRGAEIAAPQGAPAPG